MAAVDPDRLDQALTADPLLTTAEVALLFRVDNRTVGRWAADDRLHPVPTPGGRLLRFRRSEVLALLKGETDGPQLDDH